MITCLVIFPICVKKIDKIVKTDSNKGDSKKMKRYFTRISKIKTTAELYQYMQRIYIRVLEDSHNSK